MSWRRLFRPWRGTIDGTFNLLMALRKRQEHNLETYVSFVDSPLQKFIDILIPKGTW